MHFVSFYVHLFQRVFFLLTEIKYILLYVLFICFLWFHMFSIIYQTNKSNR